LKGLNHSDKSVRLAQLINSYVKALELGLTIDQQITARSHLGNLFWEMQFVSSEDPAKVKDLSDCPTYMRTLTELETAVLLDSQSTSQGFAERTFQALALAKLDWLWAIQSGKTRKQSRFDAALSYLFQKVKLLQYLGEITLPCISYQIGRYYTESEKNIRIGVEWLRRSVDAEDYYDVTDGVSTTSAIAEKFKKDAFTALRFYSGQRR
jgi:hypothetical protein